MYFKFLGNRELSDADQFFVTRTYVREMQIKRFPNKRYSHCSLERGRNTYSQDRFINRLVAIIILRRAEITKMAQFRNLK